MKIRYELLVVFLVLCVAHPALGQTEKLTLYADAGGSDCSIADTAPGLVEVHMIWAGSGGRTALHFRAPKPACWTGATWLGDVIAGNFASIGTTQSVSYTIAWTDCFDLPFYVGKMNFFGVGTGEPCCQYPVLAATMSEIPGSVVGLDCQQPFGNKVAVGAGSATINETEDCLCNPPLAVEETTWGRVKALYR
jgi:hypothetical protein